MNTKYVHVQTGNVKGTIALELPTKDYLTEVFTTHSNQCFIKIGVTKLHPKEQFEKAKGRKYAEERMMFQVGELEQIEVEGTRHLYQFHFKSNIPKIDGYYLILSTINESPNVMIVDGFFYENDK